MLPRVGKPVCACTDGIKVSVKHPTNDVCETCTPTYAPRRTHGMRTAGLHLDRKHKERRGLKQPSLPHARTPHPCPPAGPRSEGRLSLTPSGPWKNLPPIFASAPAPRRTRRYAGTSAQREAPWKLEGTEMKDGGGAGLRGAREPSPVLRNGAAVFYNARSGISGDEVEGSGGWMTLNSRKIRFRVGETQRETFRAGVGCARRQVRRRTEDLKLIINCQLQPSPIQELRTNQGRMDWKDADRRTSNKRGSHTAEANRIKLQSTSDS
jgi:hypothetical protein